MGFDPVSYLMGQKSAGGGGIKMLSREVWDSMPLADKQKYGLVAVIDSDTGYERGVVYSGRDLNPKALAETTTYCRISDTVGDGASFSNRYFTRTSDEPVVFCGYAGNSGYNSYCVISKSATAPAETHNSFGELVASGSFTVDNTTLYVYSMAGAWSQPLTNITYTYESTSLHFTTDAYMKAATTSGGSPTVEGSSAAEFVELLKMYAAL